MGIIYVLDSGETIAAAHAAAADLGDDIIVLGEDDHGYAAGMMPVDVFISGTCASLYGDDAGDLGYNGDDIAAAADLAAAAFDDDFGVIDD